MKEKITVRQASNPGQFVVENNHHELEGDFLENYISFSGYFGKHGPYVFAAGPVLVEALHLIKHAVMQSKVHGNDWRRELTLIENTCDAALAKARGEV